MISRRQLIGSGLSVCLPWLLPTRLFAKDTIPPTEVTFLVINDIHTCNMGSGLSPNCAEEGKTDENLLRHIAALNCIEDERWPTHIDGKPSGLSSAGQKIATPRGIVVSGDMTDDGGGQTALAAEGAQLLQFSHRYQQGVGPDRVHYPVYVGLGNHDLDQDGIAPQGDWYRREMREYVQMNHRPNVFFKPTVPVDNYHDLSDTYSWNWDDLHLIQAQRFAGDTNKGAATAIDWLKNDLATYAADGRPVIIFQHYGFDAFSRERWDPLKSTFDVDGTGAPHWWSDEARSVFLDALKGYNVLAIVHGHQHETPMLYQAEGYDIIKPKAAFMGGFGLIRITGRTMDVVLAEATGNDGAIRFTAAFSKTFA
mgnify:CR=1 FL=1